MYVLDRNLHSVSYELAVSSRIMEVQRIPIDTEVFLNNNLNEDDIYELSKISIDYIAERYH